MNIRYVYTKKEYKKYLYKSKLLNNIILLLSILLILYLFFKNKLVFKFYIYIIGITLIMIIFNLIYVSLYTRFKKGIYGVHELDLKDDYFTLKVNNNLSEYSYKNIKKLKEKDKYLLIIFKRSKEYLIIEKNKISIKDYNKLIKLLKLKIEEV